MKLTIASLSHVGLVRERNEDSFCHFEPPDPKLRKRKGAVFVVADGIGGHQGGDVASKLAVDVVQKEYFSSDKENPAEALRVSFEQANRAIIEKALSDPFLFGMGTTCTAMAIVDDKAYFAHIGDSRAYICRDGNIDQITQDHSLVGDMVRAGLIDKEDARYHPQRNVITRSLGNQESASPDVIDSPVILKDGDVLLLCSDGLTAFVSDEEIRDTLDNNEPDEAGQALIDLANERGGKDNITVLVVKVRT